MNDRDSFSAFDRTLAGSDSLAGDPNGGRLKAGTALREELDQAIASSDGVEAVAELLFCVQVFEQGCPSEDADAILVSVEESLASSDERRLEALDPLREAVLASRLEADAALASILANRERTGAVGLRQDTKVPVGARLFHWVAQLLPTPESRLVACAGALLLGLALTVPLVPRASRPPATDAGSEVASVASGQRIAEEGFESLADGGWEVQVVPVTTEGTQDVRFEDFVGR